VNVGLPYDGTAPDLGARESGTSPTPTPQQSPIAWYKLDETSGTTASDSSGNAFTGTLAGNPVWTPGMINGSLAFDGNGDSVSVPDTNTLDITGDITTAFWTKLTAAGDGNVIIGKEGPSSEGYPAPWFVDIANTGTPHWRWYHHTAGGDYSSALEFTTFPVPLNTWVHVAITRSISTKTASLYVNGSFIQSKTWTTDNPAASGL
jgi:hypothetical protein